MGQLLNKDDTILGQHIMYLPCEIQGIIFSYMNIYPNKTIYKHSAHIRKKRALTMPISNKDIISWLSSTKEVIYRQLENYDYVYLFPISTIIQYNCKLAICDKITNTISLGLVCTDNDIVFNGLYFLTEQQLKLVLLNRGFGANIKLIKDYTQQMTSDTIHNKLWLSLTKT